MSAKAWMRLDEIGAGLEEIGALGWRRGKATGSAAESE